jgi:hypothetical protein
MSKLVWGSLGDIVFEFLTSPVYGSLSRSKSAKFTDHPRIVTTASNGEYQGQKPLREVSGLELETYSFSLKISTMVFEIISTGVLGKVALSFGAGKLVGDRMGDKSEDERLYTDVTKYIEEIRALHDSQEPAPFYVGDSYRGDFTIESFNVREKHRTNGEILFAEIDIDLKEWVTA